MKLDVWLALALIVGCKGASASYPRPCTSQHDRDCAKLGAAPALSCDPEQQLGRLSSALPEFEALGCEGRGYVLLGPGREQADVHDLSMLHQAIGSDAFALEGVRGTGHGLCCAAEAAAMAGGCVRIYLDQCGASVDEVSAFVKERAVRAGLQERRLRVCVLLSGRSGPRCQPGDPQCGPITYQGARYVPSRSRTPVYGLRGGACAHDGDCLLGGCGNECQSWVEPEVESLCIGSSKLSDAFCGCVAGHCLWFSQ